MKKGRKRKERPSSDFLCDVAFENKLPEPLYEPKFLRVPLDKQRLVEYKGTQLERNYKVELVPGPNLGIAMDMVDYRIFNVDKQPTQLHPGDIPLLTQDAKTSICYPIFINRSQQNPQASNTKPVPAVLDSAGDKFISDIQSSFDACMSPPKHPTDPSLTPSLVVPVFPDDELWGNEYTEIVFDTNPWPGKGRGAIIQADNEYKLLYLIPKINRHVDPMEVNMEDMAYVKHGEYTYKFSKEKINPPLFFVLNDTVTYNFIPTKLMLKPTRPSERKPGGRVILRKIEELSEGAKQLRELERRTLYDKNSL